MIIVKFNLLGANLIIVLVYRRIKINKYIINRIENYIVVIEFYENNQISFINNNNENLPNKAKEDDVLIKLKEDKFFIYSKETQELSEQIKEK